MQENIQKHAASKFVGFMNQLGYRTTAREDLTQEYLQTACTNYPTVYTDEAVNVFIRENVANGNLTPVVSGNDAHLLQETASLVLNKPLDEVYGYGSVFRNLLDANEFSITRIKGEFTTLLTLKERLSILFRDVLLNMVKKPIDELYTQNYRFVLKHLTVGHADSLFTHYFQQSFGDVNKVKSLLSDKVAGLQTIHVAQRYRDIGCIEITFAVNSVPLVFLVTRKGVMCATTGYYVTTQHQSNFAYTNLKLPIAESQTITSWLLKDVFSTEQLMRSFRDVEKLDEQDVKRLARMEQYAMSAPIEANKYVGVQKENSSFILSYKHVRLVIHPKYCILPEENRFLFVRKTTVGTPLQNVTDVLVPAIHASNLPSELKDFVNRMYTVCTDLRIKI